MSDDHCPDCGTVLVSTGAPIWEYFCPNKACAYDLDKTGAIIRTNADQARRSIAPVGSRLAKLKAHRDALNAEIKLTEEGIRKAEYDACYAQQLLTVNDHRAQDSKRPLTMTEFMPGIPVDDAS